MLNIFWLTEETLKGIIVKCVLTFPSCISVPIEFPVTLGFILSKTICSKPSWAGNGPYTTSERMTAGNVLSVMGYSRLSFGNWTSSLLNQSSGDTEVKRVMKARNLKTSNYARKVKNILNLFSFDELRVCIV